MGHDWKPVLNKHGLPTHDWTCQKCKLKISSYRKPPRSSKIEGLWTCEEWQIHLVHDS